MSTPSTTTPEATVTYLIGMHDRHFKVTPVLSWDQVRYRPAVRSHFREYAEKDLDEIARGCEAKWSGMVTGETALISSPADISRFNEGEDWLLNTYKGLLGINSNVVPVSTRYEKAEKWLREETAKAQGDEDSLVPHSMAVTIEIVRNEAERTQRYDAIKSESDETIQRLSRQYGEVLGFIDEYTC